MFVVGIIAAASKYSITYSPVTQAAPLRITGYEPTGGGKYPVVLFLHGTGIDPSAAELTTEALKYLPALERGPTEHLPVCGFIFALVQYPRFDEYEPNCDYFTDKAKAMFTDSGNALEAICSRPKADCSKGVGVAGISQGVHLAGITPTLPGLAHTITAVLQISGGTKNTYAEGLGAPVSEFDCLADAAVSPHLPRSKRLSIISGADEVFGETVDEILRQQKAMSGYDCGADLDCIQPDGSGYHIIDPAFGVRHSDTPLFIAPGNEPWSLASRIEWLMLAAYNPPPSPFWYNPLPAQCRPGVQSIPQQIFLKVLSPVLDPRQIQIQIQDLDLIL